VAASTTDPLSSHARRSIHVASRVASLRTTLYLPPKQRGMSNEAGAAHDSEVLIPPHVAPQSHSTPLNMTRPHSRAPLRRGASLERDDGHMSRRPLAAIALRLCPAEARVPEIDAGGGSISPNNGCRRATIVA
jgi:hypothetical protein